MDRATKKPKKRYSKVSVEVWGDDKFLNLSPLKPSGQALWLYLLLSPYRSVIPGISLNVGLGTIADRLTGWTYDAVRKHWEEIRAQGMAEGDWVAGVIWLPKAIEHNQPESPNVVRSWGVVPLPRCALIGKALRHLRGRLAAKDPSFAAAFDQTFRASFPEGTGSPLGQSRTRTRSRSTPPPTPPQARGRLTRDDLRWARAELAQFRRDQPRYVAPVQREPGVEYADPQRCPHQPACASDHECVQRLARARHQQQVSA